MSLLAGSIGFLYSLGLTYSLYKYGSSKVVSNIQYLGKEQQKKYPLELARDARKNWIQTSGEFNSDYYDDDEIIDSYKDVMTRVPGRVRIIFGPRLDVKASKWIKFLMESQKKKLVEIRYSRNRVTPHFKLIDYEGIYQEGVHKELASREAVCLKDKEIAYYLKRRFEKLWKASEEFDFYDEISKVKPLKNKDMGQDGKFGFIKHHKDKKRAIPATKADINKIQEIISS